MGGDRHGFLLSVLIAFLLASIFPERAAAQTWVQLSPTGQPPVGGISDMDAVYNPAGNTMVVFGGGLPGGPQYNATTALAGANGLGGASAWASLPPTGQIPPARDYHTVVYDSANDRLIAFGGYAGTDTYAVSLNDVWVLINATGTAGTPSWTELSSTGGPAPTLFEHTAVYDPTSNRMIIFGGRTGSGTSFSGGMNETWVLTNANGLGGSPQWIQLQPSGTLPPGRNSHTAVYDPVSNRMIVFGGLTNGGSGTILNDTWVLTNANGLGGTPTWIELNSSQTIPGRFDHTAIYDPGSNRMMVFSGGVSYSPYTETNEVWALTNANGLGGTPAWTQLSPSAGPPLPRVGADAVYDPSSNRMTIFGGLTACSTGCTALNDVWVLTNANGTTSYGLGITQVLPNDGGNAGQVTAQVIGNGFVGGDQVSLVGEGGATVAGTNVNFVSANLLTATFNLTGAASGSYDVAVTPTSGSAAILAGGFTVVEGGAPNVYVDIIGRNDIRIGAPTTFYVVYGNSGNVDAVGVPIWVEVPSDVSLSIGFNLSSDSVLSGASAQADPGGSNIPYQVSVANSTIAGFYKPYIPAGGTGTLPITLAVSSAIEPFQWNTWVFTSFLAEATSAFVVTNPTAAIKCTADLYSFALTGAFGASPLVVDTLATLVNSSVDRPDLAGVQLSMWQIFTDIAEDDGLPAFTETELAQLSGFSNFFLTPISTIMDCGPFISIIYKKLTNFPVAALDPNDKFGSKGAGPQQFISGATPLRYSVDFGNETSATAPAQKVVITDQLDTTNDNLATLSLGPVSFGSQFVTPGPFQTTFSTTVDLRPATDLLVAVGGNLNPSTGLLTWNLQSLDPSTGQPPTDPSVGFLPPGGNGSVFFTLMPKTGLETGTQINNQATVVFDEDSPITTPTWLNTLDNTPPTSSILPLPSTESCSSFQVDWSGTDVGSGIKNFTILASDNGGAFAPWLTNTPATSATYAGQPGHSYSFYSIAEDQAGNVEAGKTSSEATTETSANPACGRPSLSGRILSSLLSGTTLTVNLQLADAGTGDARNVQINDFRLRVLTGTGIVTYLGSLPISVGDVAIGTTTTETLTFSVPSGITKFVLTEDGTLQDVPGNTYNFSIGQVVFP